MKVKRIPFDSATDFDAEIAKIVADAPGPVVVLFFGNELPETNESFCPDCVVADPLIRKAVLSHAQSATITLVEVPSGARDEWRSPDNRYRKHPQIQLARIPTLVQWTRDGPAGRLVEDECADEAKLAAFL
ncbi:hypothetical protein H9P43_008022 [Blastocladiella emersonii ATCC 22665]|nr:hypothetical protein H9P43_008022 [Blastocladiella emersonii ATCC 22665]